MYVAFSCCKHINNFNQNVNASFQHPTLFKCIWHNILLNYVMVFTKFGKMSRCVFTFIVEFQTFDFISHLNFNKGFVRWKRWKHIRFSFEKINYNEPRVVIYECWKVDQSIQRFCLHGTTNVNMYEFKCSFSSRITILKKMGFYVVYQQLILFKVGSCGISVRNYFEFQWSYFSFSKWHEYASDLNNNAT
jgi:hypothetical protein